METRETFSIWYVFNFLLIFAADFSDFGFSKVVFWTNSALIPLHQSRWIISSSIWQQNVTRTEIYTRHYSFAYISAILKFSEARNYIYSSFRNKTLYHIHSVMKLNLLINYRNSSIKPPGGLFNFRPQERGGLNREGGLFQILNFRENSH